MGLSSREYGLYISFFFGGRESAAPVLVKHIARDLLRFLWGTGVGVVNSS